MRTMTKSNNVFSQSAVPAFEGRFTKLSSAAAKTLGPSRLQNMKLFFGRLLKRIPGFARNTADDAVRSKAGRGVLSWAAKKARRVGAMIAGGITAAVVFAQNTADDIKLRLRTKVKPVSLIKDIASKAKEQVSAMNSVDYAALERMKGPGFGDVVEKTTAGVSASLGVDLNKSAKHVLWSKMQSLFTSQ